MLTSFSEACMRCAGVRWNMSSREKHDESIQRAADLLRQARAAVALTGAGISTPSGIPDFRSPGSGLWAYVDPAEVASIWSYRQNPERFYEWMRPLAEKLLRAKPNPAHKALARLEHMGIVKAVITQNIDSLHQKAGSERVIEVHGHTRTATCLTCGYHMSTETVWAHVLRGEMPPPCPRCHGLMKPVMGELLPPEALTGAQEAALHADVMLVVGSSLEVMPAADLPRLTYRSGGKLIVVNLGSTTVDHLADVVIRADVARVLPRLVRAVEDLSRSPRR